MKEVNLKRLHTVWLQLHNILEKEIYEDIKNIYIYMYVCVYIYIYIYVMARGWGKEELMKQR